MLIIINSILFKSYSKTKRKVEDNSKCDAVLSAHGCFIFACKSTNDILVQREKNLLIIILC